MGQLAARQHFAIGVGDTQHRLKCFQTPLTIGPCPDGDGSMQALESAGRALVVGRTTIATEALPQHERALYGGSFSQISDSASLLELVSPQFFGKFLPVASALAITKGKSSDFHTDHNPVTLVLQLTDKEAYLSAAPS
eukprot:5936392-Amphidinium_carterae.1